MFPVHFQGWSRRLVHLTSKFPRRMLGFATYLNLLGHLMMNSWFHYILQSLDSSISGHLWALDISAAEGCETRILWLPRDDDLICGCLMVLFQAFTSVCCRNQHYLLAYVIYSWYAVSWSLESFPRFTPESAAPNFWSPVWQSCKTLKLLWSLEFQIN